MSSLRSFRGWVASLDQRGGASWLTYLLLIAAVAAGYLLWVYSPVYIDNYDAKSKCTEALNRSWRYHDEARTETVLRRLLGKVAKVTRVENGETIQAPAIDPEEEDMSIEIDQSVTPAILSVRFSYPRTVVFPVLKKEKVKWFTVECELSLNEVKW